MTKKYAEVIGDPVSHSKSPLIHNFWLKKLRMADKYEYRATHVKPEGLADYFEKRRADLNWLGCNVTIPHKEAAAKIIQHRLAGYGDFGAINVVVPNAGELVGGNTDVDGVISPINGFHDMAFNYGSVPKRVVAIIGAGGAARAAAYGIKHLGLAKNCRILVRRPEQGKQLVEEIGITAQILPIESESLNGVDILINASPLGMQGMPSLNLTLKTMGSGIDQPLVFEMVYAPLETELLKTARAEALKTIDGLEMLMGQADGAFRHFFKESAPRQYDAELRALLEHALLTT